MKNRHERIRASLTYLATLGVIGTGWYSQGQMPGKRWHVEPMGYSQRAMTTNEIEWFIMGAYAVIGDK